MAKLLVRGLSSAYNALADKSAYANSIVFLTDTKQIVNNGIYYGLSDTDAAKLNTLASKFDEEGKLVELKSVNYFNGISDGTDSYQISTPGLLTVKGENGINVTASANGLVLSTKGLSDIVATKVAGVTSNSQVVTVDNTDKTNPIIDFKIDETATKGNVVFSTSADGLAANVTLNVTAINSTDKILTLSNGEVSSTLNLSYVKDEKKIKLTGKDSEVIAEIDATDFVKDGMISKEATKFDSTTNKLTLGFNTDAGVEAFEVDLTSLVDIYDGSNVKLKNLPEVTSYVAPKNGDSVDTAIANLAKGVTDAKASGVLTIGGKTGDITLKANTEDRTVSLNMSEDGEISATLKGIGTAASSAVEDFATSEQGEKADTALQTVRANNAGTYVKVTASVTEAKEVQLIPEVIMQTIIDATSTNDGLAKASDVKSYIDNSLEWEEL